MPNLGRQEAELVCNKYLEMKVLERLGTLGISADEVKRNFADGFGEAGRTGDYESLATALLVQAILRYRREEMRKANCELSPQRSA